MSIEIDWAKLTSGDDGLALAESIRVFIHDKFQEVTLPGFIRSVEVHSFEFGQQCPEVVIKDICDPLPDFYEDDSEEDEDEESPAEENDDAQTQATGPAPGARIPAPSELLVQRQDVARRLSFGGTRDNNRPMRPLPTALPTVDNRLLRLHSTTGHLGPLASPLLSRSSTPGIPGGTSNMSYFHLPLSARLQGSQMGLAAMAGSSGHGDHHGHPWEQHTRRPSPQKHAQDPDYSFGDPSTRPSTATSYGHSHEESAQDAFNANDDKFIPEPEPSDLQIVLHISYSGDIRLSLTAEILLDYPMPSFVGIPLKLNITGMSFDGVALIAYLKKRAHFCFLGQDDAEMLVGAENALDKDGNEATEHGKGGKSALGGLLKEIRVESEIGQKDGGKQVLKNVGKVEKFVLEQVRRIFEEEMVWPSFWTFLV
jgi:distribution and morphology protein 12